ncbi:UDP-N-acetylglucosamine transferase subunit [Bonamia ostreae]|uniref:UDP-N-acetylglucosamine transferase subunit ALG14 n=1 Tax=Bonamia ostreae TaxID=126728 RepID=A0ABV2AEI3_9EUKA
MVIMFAISLVIFTLPLIIYLCSTKNDPKCETLIFLGSGGHTSEMIRLFEDLDLHKYARLGVMTSFEDTLSRKKAEKRFKRIDRVSIKLPRARRVGQSWLTTIFSSVFCLVIATKKLFHANPKMVVTNGPGTTVLIYLAVRILNSFLCRNTKFVFVESICRVKTLSLTGKILYFCGCDKFYVQWRELKAKYRNALYLGRIY